MPDATPDRGPSDQERIAAVSAENQDLRALVAAQADRIASLESQLEDLRSQLKQDSGNSSAPPSRDRTDRRERRAAERAERKAKQREQRGGAPDRKPGKQPGAPGKTLMRRAPDRTVTHAPKRCGCGSSLEGAPVVGVVIRQVLEVPEPRLEATDHVAQRRRCGCGAETTAAFPPEATAPVCWGPRAKATAAYLMARQHLPLERAAEAMADLFAAPMGQGTLAGVLPDAAGRLCDFLERLYDLLGECPVCHADETSIRVGTALGWVHTVSTSGLTLLAYHRRRGLEAIIDIGVLGDYEGTIVHDGWASYDKLDAATHAQCGAHLLRHLDNVAAAASQRAWAKAMCTVLLDAKAASESAAGAGLGAVPASTAARIRRRYRATLKEAFAGLPDGAPPRRRHTGTWTTTQREAWNLATRMRDGQAQVLRLLVDTRVPLDNNEAERSLRMAKLHDKISGVFRSARHAEAFLTVRSYLQTGRKHGRMALELLVGLWTATGAWLPANAVPDT